MKAVSRTAALLVCLAVSPAAAADRPTAGDDSPLLIGGIGGVYFLAEPGELVVDVFKRDRNERSVRTELRAILIAPDRVVRHEATLADDGRPAKSGLGPLQHARLATRVERRGVYALNVTISQDRYGLEAIWGFRSNCPKYLIESARGHKDERHQEPIVLASPGRRADICFAPRLGAFTVEATGLPPNSPALAVLDAGGAVLATLAVDGQGRAAHAFDAAAAPRTAPWRLRLPSAAATVGIDSVTRWDNSDLHPDLACWTPEATSWFSLLENRWLLTPYSSSAYGRPGTPLEVTFQVRNDAPARRIIRLGLEFPGDPWPAQLAVDRVELAPREATAVVVRGPAPAPGQVRQVHLRATPEEGGGFSTYSTLSLRGGEAPAAQPLALPLVLTPFRHENEQFGHRPRFSLENQLYFDLQNRPFARLADGLTTVRAAQWAAIPHAPGTASVGSKIAFDRLNRLYVLASANRSPALLSSADGGQTFAAAPIPARERAARAFELEDFTGHNLSAEPPPFLRYTQTAKDEKLFWRSLNDLELFLPRWVDGRLDVGAPILITRQCIGLSSHSGSPASIVSRGTKVHVVWGEATDPAIKVAGVPAYVATFDRATGRLSPPALVGYGAPANDIHNSPSITMDSRGYLHVLGGTHGRPFPYARSLQPNDAGGGWTEPAPTGDNLPQTYIGLVCGPDDTLHAVFRLWRSQTEPFPASSHATLAYQRKRPGQPWEPPRVLIVPPFSEYSVFYHRLTIDRRGRLFLSYDYWSTHWFYRNDHLGRRRTALLSPDGGDTWKLAQLEDLL